jgi:predicted  nucleic acid-binding Zn-ribbon protein
MSEQADIEAALARATAAYKNVRAERDALKDANDRAEAAEAERDRLREALEKAEAELKALKGDAWEEAGQ